jgi:hypothetical protein
LSKGKERGIGKILNNVVTKSEYKNTLPLSLPSNKKK